MNHLKEQLKTHYEKTQPSEEFLQKLMTLQAPQAAPAPVRVHPWRKYLTPIAAMFIIAVSILGGGKYLMDAMPLTAIPPECAPTEVVPVESAADFEDVEPTDVETDLVQDIMPTAPADPEPGSIVEPAPEKTAPEQSSSGVTTPQPPTPTAPSNPAPPDDITDPTPPIEDAGPADDPTPPLTDDVPPNDTGEDDPPTAPGEYDPVDPPDEPGSLPDDPVDPPDEPVVPPIEIPDIPYPPDYKPGDGETSARPAGEQKPPASAISGRYAYEFGQHMVYLTNCDTGESSSLNLTAQFTGIGYYGTYNLFGYMVDISLIEPTWELVPASEYVFSVVAEVVM